MIISEKKIYQTISSFYSKIDSNSIKKGIISDDKMRNSGNYNYYLRSVVLRKGFLIQAGILVYQYTGLD